MSKPIAIQVLIHPDFEEYEADMSELKSQVQSFVSGDSGCLNKVFGEDEVLDFMSRSLDDRARHGVYDTESGGRVHIIGNSQEVKIVPDLVFAWMRREAATPLSKCTCAACSGQPN